MSASLPEAPASRVELRPRIAAPPRAATAGRVPHNWMLYLFLLLLPLQNLQTGYLPNLGAGINFLNIGFVLALLGAWACRGRISRWSSVHVWIAAYLLYGYASLYVGYANVHDDTAENFGNLKDSMLAQNDLGVRMISDRLTDQATLPLQARIWLGLGLSQLKLSRCRDAQSDRAIHRPESPS